MALLHENARPLTLGFVRAWVFLIWLAKIMAAPLWFLAELPPSMLETHGPFAVVPETAWVWLLTPTALTGLKALLIVTVAWAAVGVRPYRPVALVAVALLTLYQGLACGFTFVNHQELGLLLVALVLALFPSADGFSPTPRRSVSPATYGAALVTMTLLLLLPYAAIAAYRLSREAPALFLNDSMAYWLASLSGVNPDGPSLGLWVLDRPALAFLMKLGFPVITLFELTAPLVLIAPRFRVLWLAVIGPFHVLSWLLMNVLFWENLLLMTVLLTNVTRWLPRLGRLRER